jgi:AraC-like DNA-binding protein
MSQFSSVAVEPNFPVNRNPVIHTKNFEEMRHAMVAFYGAREFSADEDGFEGFGSFAQLDGGSFGFCGYATRASAEFGENEYARLQLPLRGQGRTSCGPNSVEIDPQRFCVSSPGTSTRLEFGPNYQQMILRFASSRLNETLEAMLGVKPRGKLTFTQQIGIDDRGARPLMRLALFLAEQVDPAQPSLPPMMLRELHQALTVSFLCVARHNFSDQLDRDAPDTAPDYVRVAEDYIAASWNKAITVTDLAAVTNVGMRSLFKAFQKHRGYSPMAFAKSVRLNKARELLLTGDSNRSVTSVAFACGFSNLGHFAHDYRQKHGELPSETLARAR